MSAADANPASRCPLLNPDVGSNNLCTGEQEFQFYGYNVTLWVSALFVALFALTFIAHTIQMVLSRRWWTATIVIAAGVETLGWAGRLWSSLGKQWIPFLGGVWISPRTAFLMQISTLIFAPAFLAAFWYIALGQLIRYLGPQYCRFNPKTYAIVFITGDVISLVVQAVGGGLASAAETLRGANRGAYIMVGGVCFQMLVMILFSILLVEFVLRYTLKKPVKQFRLRKTKPIQAVPDGSLNEAEIKRADALIGAMVFSTLMIFIRSIYRTVELLGGWTGDIIEREDLFCVLDGLMVLLAIVVLNIEHPMWTLPRRSASDTIFQAPEESPQAPGQKEGKHPTA